MRKKRHEDDEVCTSYTPTSEEIAQGCENIRSGWDEKRQRSQCMYQVRPVETQVIGSGSDKYLKRLINTTDE